MEEDLLLVRAVRCAVVCNSLECKQADGAGVGQPGAAARGRMARDLVTVAGLELRAEPAVADELEPDAMDLLPVALLAGDRGFLEEHVVGAGIYHVTAVPLGHGWPGVPGGVAVLNGL